MATITHPPQITARVLGDYGMLGRMLHQDLRMRHDPKLGPMARREILQIVATLRHNRRLLATGAWCPALDYIGWV